MEWLFDLLLRPSAEATVILILVLLVQRVLGSRLPACWHHGLWALVFLRLLVPALPSSPWSLFQFTPEASGIAALPGLEAWIPTATQGIGEAPSTKFSWAPLLAGVWLAGLLFFALRRLQAQWAWHRQLRQGRPLTTGRLAAVFASCQRDAGLGERIELVAVPSLAGPAACGVLRPRIVVPEGFGLQMSDEELRHVLLHELAHVRRRDLLTLEAAGWLAVIHWFNPLLRWAVQHLRDDCELACDAAVLHQLEPKARPSYGRTLLRLTTTRPTSAPLLGISLRQQLERRIQMISNYRPTSPIRTLFATAVLAALAIVSLTDATPADPEAGTANEQQTTLDLEKQKKTIVDLRTIGAAMHAWLSEQPRQSGKPASENDGKSVDWKACPAISFVDLERLLVPARLPELPRNDPWGNAYEFCLDRSLGLNPGLIGIRATGKDGEFAGSRYQVGPFPAAEFQRDVVWQDGYFITWPVK